MELSSRASRLLRRRPAICVPVAGPDPDDVVAQVEAAGALSDVDIIEWRADTALAHLRPAQLRTLARRVREACADRALLVTLRTLAEGGEAKARPARYLDLCATLVRARPDALDVELSQDLADEVVEAAHDAGVAVVVSHHNWGGPVASKAWDETLSRAGAIGADVVKIAQSTPTPAQALAFLGVIETYCREEAALPLIAAGMGECGPLVRVSAPVMGAQATFASVGAVTAPGQIALADLVRAWSGLGLR